jgi:phosphatidylinositol alpha-1,6-mannosyltransferase
MLRRQLGIPYVVYVHGKDLLKERRKGQHRWLVRAGTREILGNAAAIIANSAATATLARQLLRDVGREDAGARVRVIHPGADPSRFADAVELARHDRADEREGPVLLSVARLVQRKGIDTVIEALPAILAAHPTATYVVVGSGPDLTRLQQLASSIGVGSRVRFVGDVHEDELPSFYASADIFVLPTREILADDEIEGFGIAYVEASAAGVPCIGADVGGVADAVIDGVTGILVPPASTASVAHALLRLLDDASLRARLGANGRATVARDLNWDRAAREVVGLVNEVIRPDATLTADAAAEALIRRQLGQREESA